MEKPVYFEDTDPTPLETRIYEVTLRVEVKNIPLTEDENTTNRDEIDRPIERLLREWERLNPDVVSAEIIDSKRTADLESTVFEHIPKLENVLRYLSDFCEPGTRTFAAKASGAHLKRVMGNRVW